MKRNPHPATTGAAEYEMRLETLDAEINDRSATRDRVARNYRRDYPNEAPRETNVEFVTRVMESGSPLRQAFVIDAVSKYADACAAVHPDTFDSPMLNGAAWHQVAKEIKAECDARFSPPKKRSA